jgi:RHS repeat-associated protein
VNSCKDNQNPCHPSTGDKSRAETDFDFAGRPFTRYYHSRSEFRMDGAAIGWSHTYSERMQNDANGNPYLLSAQGYYEGFKRIGTTGRHYRALNSPDRFVDTFDTGTVRFRLRDGSGEVREYGTVGLLLNIRNPDNPSNDVEIVYGFDLLYNDVPRLIGVVDKNGRMLAFDYDYSKSLITRIIRPDGSVVNYEYDIDSNLTAVDFGNGQRKLYHYHETGLADPVYLNHLTGITSENGQRYASFGYDSAGRVTSSKLHGPNGFVATTQVNYTGTNTATVNSDTGDTRGYTMAPGTYRRVTGFSDGAGTTSSVYDADSRITSNTDKRGIVTQYEYTDNYRSAINEAVGTTSARRTVMVRDVNNRLTRREQYGLISGAQQLQRIESNVYNAEGRMSFVCEADALVTAAAAYVCGSATNAPAGVRQSAYTYCSATDVATANSTCPILGLIKTVDGPRTDVSDVMTYTYRAADDAACATTPSTCAYRKGDLWKVTNALNHVVEYVAYDGSGRVKQMKDADGVITDREYHPRGWLTASKVRGLDNASEIDDAITRMDYDALGQVTRVTQADGDYINFTYDAAHRLTGINDAFNNRIAYTLDNAGNRTKEETFDPSNVIKRSVGSVYDTLGRLQAVKNAANVTVASMTFDADSNVDKTTDGLGRISDQNVDPLNRLMQSIQDQGTGKVNATTKLAYDARDNVTQVTDPKNRNTTYVYNGLNDLTKQTSPDTGVTSFTYDSAGNRASQTDAKTIVTNYAYDVLNRLTQVSYPSAATLGSTYAYDTVNAICTANETFAKGRLTQLTDPSGNTQYCYNRLGQLTRKQQTNNGNVSTLVMSYTKAGRLSSVTYPSGMVVGYLRNNLGQIDQVNVTQGGITKIFANNITYQPFGPLTKIEFLPPSSSGGGTTLLAAAAPGGGGCQPSNGGCTPVNPVIQSRGYDLDGAIDYVGGLNYSVDVLGNITQIADAAGGNNYQYDSIDRLTKVINSNTLADVTALTYDATGNRLSKKVGAAAVQTYTYPSTNHRLSNDSTFARTYDANGNTTRSATAKYFGYDARNRMVNFRTGSAASTIVSQYQFNGKGERVRKYKGTTDQARYLYNENGQLLVQDKIIAGATTTQEIIWLDDMPIGVRQGGSMYGILTDHLNTPRRIFNMGTQLTAWSWNAVDDAFGESAAVASGLEFDLRFPGQLYDSESGLHYNYLRDGYESGVGRYTQSDPIGLDGGMSSYNYVFANPMNSTDMLGLSPDEPGFGDQINPFGSRGSGNKNYTNYFDARFPKTIAGGKAVFGNRIKEKICANKKGLPKTIIGMNDGQSDIDISPDMGRFGDAAQSWNERNVKIGYFELKTSNISVVWSRRNGCDCYNYSATMYVKENTGDNRLGAMFRERDVTMARWNLNGKGCCEK